MKKFAGFLWRKKWWVVIGVLAVVAAWWFFIRDKETVEPFVLVKPEVRDIVQTLDVSGKVDAEQKASLSFAAPSRLTWVGVKEGDWVKKWQGVARVDTRTLQKQLLIAQNTHGKTFRTYEETLDDVDYWSQSGLTDSERRSAEAAQLDISSSALSVEIADLAVQLSLLYSPIDGLVTRVDQPNVGATVKATDVYEIVDPSSVYFAVVIDEEDVSAVSGNQSALITLDAFADETIGSEIYQVGFTPTVSESGGTGYKAWLTLPINNEAMTYKLGMNGDARIILAKREQVLAVPVDALIEREGVTFVEVMRDGNRERTEIVTGIDDQDYIEVISGITSDDDVVIPTSS